MIGIVGSPVSAAKANVDANAGMAGFTQEQVQLAITIMNNLKSYNDSNLYFSTKNLFKNPFTHITKNKK